MEVGPDALLVGAYESAVLAFRVGYTGNCSGALVDTNHVASPTTGRAFLTTIPMTPVMIIKEISCPSTKTADWLSFQIQNLGNQTCWS